MSEITIYKGSPSGEIVQDRRSLPRPTGSYVLVRVTHSGICGSDQHFLHRDMVLGHEGAGMVEGVGDRVRELKVGDRVGWGFQHGSCMNCRFCLRGEEQYCPERKTYGNASLDQGSFATAAIWPEKYLFLIPESMTNAEAAPMMCAGASVFGPLRRWNVTPTQRVGVMGVGGLGHLAIQFAGKMGCEVVVLSRTAKKEEEARKLGATEFHVFDKGETSPPTTLKDPIDHLLVTTAKQPHWPMVCEIISNGGTVHCITISLGELTIPYMCLIDKALHLQGSLPASTALHRDMLKFSARHGIKPMLTPFPMTLNGIQQAFKALEQGEVRYRGVLVNE